MSLSSLAYDLAYIPTYWSAYCTFTFGFGLRVRGHQYIPPHGPALIVSNHQSFMDPVLLGCAGRRRLTYLARSNLFENAFLRPLIRFFRAVPIDRGFGKEGLLTVLNQLAQGQAVLMFVEGERTHTGELQPLKPGVSLLIKRVTCPIIPVGIAGAYEAWPRHQKWPKCDPLFGPGYGRSLGVAYGPPIDPSRYAKLDRDAILGDLFQEIAACKQQAEQIRRKPWRSRAASG